jgi:DNA-binding transcriptional LysR family regulator
MILAAVAGIGLCQMPHCLFRKDVDAGRLVEVLGYVSVGSDAY